MTNHLSPVIHVDEKKCRNCHACISVCPVKLCIDGSGDKVTINHDLCIGCGRCISACEHKARGILDDTDTFFNSLAKGEKIIAIVAPASAAVFPGSFLKLNTFLKNSGVDAVFDVSFGAELTVKSYIEHIKNNSPEMVIAQPCPAIVSYIEIFRPDLMRYLAPADSPMLHTIKMIREYYPVYSSHRIAAISPCPAKKREFEEVAPDVMNVTMINLSGRLKGAGIEIRTFSDTAYDNPPAERAVLFSTPGGLLQTAMREMPGIASSARKIEGPEIVYKYLDTLKDAVSAGHNPLLVDCLNCELGCNGGAGTGNSGKSPDEIEHHVKKRSERLIDFYKSGKRKRFLPLLKRGGSIGATVNRFWKKSLYERTYLDRSLTSGIKTPSADEKREIFARMLKYSDEDIINCCSCGYNSCDMMAKAVFNKLNKPQNCNYYREKIIEKERESLENINSNLREKISHVNASIENITLSLEHFVSIVMKQAMHLGESSAAVEQMLSVIKGLAENAGSRKIMIENIAEKAHSGENNMRDTLDAMNAVTESVSGIFEMTEMIKSISSNTNLLSLNAAIEAAHAGAYGKGFAVVADEIGRLAESAAENSGKISETLGAIENHVGNSRKIAEKSGESMQQMMLDIRQVASVMSEILVQMNEMSAGSNQVTASLRELKSLTDNVKNESESITDNIRMIKDSVRQLAVVSDETMWEIAEISGSRKL